MKDILNVKNKSTKIIIAIVMAVLLMWVSVFAYIYISSHLSKKEISSENKIPETIVEEKKINKKEEGKITETENDVNNNVELEIKILQEKISKFITLPTDDSPQLFEIDDPKQLIGKQAFFKDVLKGDKLLVYPKSAKAVVYRESSDKIINIGPVSFDDINKK
jgi:hypothetical protein